MKRWKKQFTKLAADGVTQEELDSFNAIFGSKVNNDKLTSFAADRNITLPSGEPPAPPVYQGGGVTTSGATTTSPSGYVSTEPPSGYISLGQQQYNWQEGLINAEGAWTLDIQEATVSGQLGAAQIRADADREISRAETEAQRYASELGLKGIESQTAAQRYLGELGLQGTRLQTDAQRYLGELGLQGTKYAADKESEWRKAVAGIEVEGRLNLQPIINAGLARVAEIEGAAARDVAETTGRYGLESTRTRSEADKAIGKMQLAGAQYGLIGSVFG